MNLGLRKLPDKDGKGREGPVSCAGQQSVIVHLETFYIVGGFQRILSSVWNSTCKYQETVKKKNPQMLQLKEKQ